MKCKSMLMAMILGIIALMLPILALTEEKAEVKEEASCAQVTSMERPRVVGIKEFHDVMAPVWHSLLPDGDFKGVREKVPEFQKSLQILMEAEVPEYYMHIKETFDAKRQALALAVAKLDTVAQGDNNEQLAAAVEEMHTAFEQMARTLAPRMGEIDRFHLILYPLWHQALPKSDYAAIKATMPLLEAKMDTLLNAPIPERYKEIEASVVEKRAELKKSVNELVAACKEGKEEQIKDKLTVMHETYRALDGAFE